MFRRKKKNTANIAETNNTKHETDLLKPLDPLYKTIFESMLDGVVVQDKDGKIVATNNAARTILNMPDETLKGKSSLSPVWQNIHEDGSDFPGETHPAMVAIKTKKPVENVIMGLRTPTVKETTWLRVNARPVLTNGELTYVVATFSDITAEKSKSIELSNLYRSSRDLLGIANVNGYFEQVNGSVKSMLGYTEDEFVLKPFLFYIHPDDIESTNAEVDKLSHGQNIIDFINRYRHKDGHYINIQWNATPIGTKLYCIGRDISEHVNQMEQEKSKNELLNFTTDAIYSTNLSGIVLFWNKAAETLYGYTEKEMVGQSIKKIMPKESTDLDYILGKIKKGEKIIGFETVRKCKSGELVDVSLSVTPITNLAGDIVSASMIARNITDSKTERDRIKYALEGAKDGIWDWNMVNNTVFFSKRWKEMLGYGDKDNMHTLGDWVKSVHPDDYPKVIKIVQDHIEGKTKEFSSLHRAICKDGSYKWILDRGKITAYDKNNKPIRMIGTHTDVTDMQRQAKENEDLKIRFHFATESAKIGVWEWDLITNALVWDDRMYKLYGVSKDDFSGAYDAWTSGLHKDDRKRSEDEINKAVKLGKIFNTTFRVVWPDGTTRQIRAYGKPIKDASDKAIKMVGLSWDITTEVDNIKNTERFKLAVDAAYDHIIICDVKGKIIYANDSAVRTTGYSKSEMLGKTPSLWGGQMPPEFYKKMWHTISVLKKPFVGEVSNIRKGGESYIAEAHISPILDETGKNVEFYLGVEKDITLLKEVDKSKTEFVSLASHQLRTPLSAVNWYAELLLDENTGTLNDDQKSYINEITSGNQRMVALVNSLLNISRLELGTFEITPKNINPLDIASDVLKELEQQIKQNNLKVIDESPKATSKYSADPELLRIVLQNLLSNAVKYTPAKGVIKYSVGISGDKFMIIVTDTGRGIPSHQKDNIFTKLFRADNVRELDIEGTGLGLYVVKSIVEQSGGSISFTSQLNKGTTFTISLPKQGMLKKKGITGLEQKKDLPLG